MKKLLIAFLLSVLPFSVHAADFYVATNGTGQGTSWADATNNLQGAISGCASGETCWVSNGTYVGNFTVGAGVTVRSIDNNPASVILDGGYPATSNIVVVMQPSSWLIGCTAQNGWNILTTVGAIPGSAGVQRGSISNCIVTRNTTIGHPSAGGSHGAGIAYCTAYNSVISFNLLYESEDGAGAGASYSTLFDCIINNNSNIAVVGMHAAYGGGTAYSALTRCVVASNKSSDFGGGCYEDFCTNCVISGNNSGSNGGGGSYLRLLNCVVSGNVAGTIVSGYGLYKAYYVINCIVWNTYADVSWSLTTNLFSCGVGYTNVGCIATDPLFVSANDFHLQSNSPCINTGANGAWIDAGTKDLAGNQRIWPQGGTVDMGAYEYGSPPSYPAVITIHGSGLNLYGQGLSIRGTAQ